MNSKDDQIRVMTDLEAALSRVKELEVQVTRVTGRRPNEVDYILPWCTHYPRHILIGSCSDRPAMPLDSVSEERQRRMMYCSAHQYGICPDDCAVGGNRSSEGTPDEDAWPTCVYGQCPNAHAPSSMFCSEHLNQRELERKEHDARIDATSHPTNEARAAKVERPRAGRLRIIAFGDGKDEQVEVDEAWLLAALRTSYGMLTLSIDEARALRVKCLGDRLGSEGSTPDLRATYDQAFRRIDEFVCRAWDVEERHPTDEAKLGAKADCDNCHGTGTWHSIVWDCENPCPCVNGPALKSPPAGEAMPWPPGARGRIDGQVCIVLLVQVDLDIDSVIKPPHGRHVRFDDGSEGLYHVDDFKELPTDEEAPSSEQQLFDMTSDRDHYRDELEKAMATIRRTPTPEATVAAVLEMLSAEIGVLGPKIDAGAQIAAISGCYEAIAKRWPNALKCMADAPNGETSLPKCDTASCLIARKVIVEALAAGDMLDLGRGLETKIATAFDDNSTNAGAVDLVTWIARHPDIGDSLTAAAREKEFQKRARDVLAGTTTTNGVADLVREVRSAAKKYGVKPLEESWSNLGRLYAALSALMAAYPSGEGDLPTSSLSTRVSDLEGTLRAVLRLLSERDSRDVDIREMIEAALRPCSTPYRCEICHHDTSVTGLGKCHGCNREHDAASAAYENLPPHTCNASFNGRPAQYTEDCPACQAAAKAPKAPSVATCGWCGETNPDRLAMSPSATGFWCIARHSGPRK